MREIKFRAWDKIQKRMLMFASQFLDRIEWSYDGINFGGADKSPENYEIMQFTSLHDKNGKEIYEGDILKCDDANEDHQEFTTEVWFCNGQFLTGHYGFPVHSWSGKENSWCEVIGNIYQTPELLENNK